MPLPTRLDAWMTRDADPDSGPRAYLFAGTQPPKLCDGGVWRECSPECYLLAELGSAEVIGLRLPQPAPGRCVPVTLSLRTPGTLDQATVEACVEFVQRIAKTYDVLGKPEARNVAAYVWGELRNLATTEPTPRGLDKATAKACEQLADEIAGNWAKNATARDAARYVANAIRNLAKGDGDEG